VSKQKVILPILVLVIFVVIVAFGLKGLSEKEEVDITEAEGLSGEPAGGVPIEFETLPLEGLAPEVPKWGSPATPMQSLPLEESEIPEEATRIGIIAEGITPSIFESEKAQQITLSVSSNDKQTHIFKFKDTVLAKASIGVGPGQIRIISFYAPEESGEYEYYCDVPGHEARGEIGKIVVK